MRWWRSAVMLALGARIGASFRSSMIVRHINVRRPPPNLLSPAAVRNRAPPTTPPKDPELPKMNADIRAPELRVIIDRGDQPDETLGVISREEALAKAKELGVDLVLIADKDPPVCKIVNYGKLRYAKEKKKKEQMKKMKSNEIKEVKMSYKIGDADYQVRRRAGAKFIQAGNRVKLAIQFRGREQQHMHLGEGLISKFVDDLGLDGVPVAKTKIIREGRDLTTILSAKS
ncbi:hypothetical protein CTAYLR_002217 [Chrysophaeum taylorii]|uniref:Translation initiation factor IF-3 n=1 Tax=Chrysophaeum taylorii TaxID=2483200 RepID=A0AAD7UPX9_9STRA|nr:hypothetical protein CTAYLR_002217 [Chrysophaeum taylorii]